MDTVTFLNLSYDSSRPEESIKDLALAARPSWSTSEGSIKFKYFTQGLTNILINVSYQTPAKLTNGVSSSAPNGTTSAQSPANGDSLMLRVYGPGTDQLIDRERELRAHATLAKRGLAPKLLARFRNGILYEYVPGVACNFKELTDPRVYRPVARELARWHTLVSITELADASGKVTDMWDVMWRWIGMLQTADRDEAKLSSPPIRKNEKETTQELTHELGQLQDRLKNIGLPHVFAHCDLLSGNVVISEKLEPPTVTKLDLGPDGQPANGTQNLPSSLPETPEAKVTFIDYEYAAGAPAAFDLANHFAEWGGFECHVSLRPDEARMRDFIRIYVSERTKCVASRNDGFPSSLNESQVDQEVESLLGHVKELIAVPAFFWGLWARVQTRKSKIDFDYGSYSRKRLDEYYEWKKENGGVVNGSGTGSGGAIKSEI